MYRYLYFRNILKDTEKKQNSILINYIILSRLVTLYFVKKVHVYDVKFQNLGYFVNVEEKRKYIFLPEKKIFISTHVRQKRNRNTKRNRNRNVYA